MPDRFYDALLDLTDTTGATLHMASYVATQTNGLHTVDLWGNRFPDTLALLGFTPPAAGTTVAVVKSGQSLLLLGGVATGIDPTWWWAADDVPAGTVTGWTARVGPDLTVDAGTGTAPVATGDLVTLSADWTGGFVGLGANTTAAGWLLYVVADQYSGDSYTVPNILYAQATDNTGPYLGLAYNSLLLDAYAGDGPDQIEYLFPAVGDSPLEVDATSVIEIAQTPNATTLTARVNGTDLAGEIQLLEGVVGNIALDEVYIGGNWAAGLREIIVYNDASDAHRAEARAYLAGRYGVPT